MTNSPFSSRPFTQPAMDDIGHRPKAGALAFRYEDAPVKEVRGSHNFMLSHVCLGNERCPTEGFHLDVHRYPRGGGSNINVHDFCEQAYFIIEGQGEATVGEETKGVGPGDFIFIPKLAPHNIKNVGDGELVLLFISTDLVRRGRGPGS